MIRGLDRAGDLAARPSQRRDHVKIDEVLKQLRQMHDERAATIADLEGQISFIQTELNRIRKPLNDLAETIKDLVLREGRTIEAHGVKVSFRNGYTRASWDGKLLDGFAMAHPEILAARKESVVSPSASVKILERETA